VSIRADEVMHREYNHHFADISKNESVEGEKLYLIGIYKINDNKGK
jgi:hypothetical protein